jgi:hypothetical protein
VLSNPFVCKDCGQMMRGKQFTDQFPCRRKA